MWFDCNSTQALDAKGRVVIPARYREQLGDQVAMTRGEGACLYVYPQSSWDSENMPQLLAVPETDTHAFRKVRMKLMTMASNLEIDKQGRLLIPPALRRYAQLEREIVIGGSGRHIEIWDAQLFEAFIDKVQQRADEEAEREETL